MIKSSHLPWKHSINCQHVVITTSIVITSDTSTNSKYKVVIILTFYFDSNSMFTSNTVVQVCFHYNKVQLDIGKL